MDETTPDISPDNGSEEMIRKEIGKYLPIVMSDDGEVKKWFDELTREGLHKLLEAVKFHTEWHWKHPEPDAIVDSLSNPRQMRLAVGPNSGRRDFRA